MTGDRSTVEERILSSLSEHGPLGGADLAQQGIPVRLLYPALERLIRAGALERTWVPQATGPARRLYFIPPT